VAACSIQHAANQAAHAAYSERTSIAAPHSTAIWCQGTAWQQTDSQLPQRVTHSSTCIPPTPPTTTLPHTPTPSTTRPHHPSPGPCCSFADENFIGRHTGPGLLSMANSGPNSNGCQFFLTCAKTEWLDQKHVVFGRVTGDSMLVLRKLENVAVGAGNKPRLPAVITECGEM
jgi:hypothetical protein